MIPLSHPKITQRVCFVTVPRRVQHIHRSNDIPHSKSNRSWLFAIRLALSPLCSSLPFPPHSDQVEGSDFGVLLRSQRAASEAAAAASSGIAPALSRLSAEDLALLQSGPRLVPVRGEGNTARVHTYLAWTLPSCS